MTKPPAAAPDAATRVDGRVMRGSRNRDAIVDAVIDLNLEGVLVPGVAEVAARAKVSERSVYRHFDDMAGLHEAAARRHLERIAPLIVDVAPDGPLGARLEAFVTHRAALLEANSPIRRATDARAPSFPELAEILRRARRALRRQVAETFAPELARLAPGEREIVLEAMDVVACWDTWEQLRTHQHLGYDRAAAVVRRCLGALLGA